MAREVLLPLLFIHYFNMKINDITRAIEKIAPLKYQEEYDNSGLIIGHPEDEVTGVLLSLDTTEEVIDEAISRNLNLIVAHHPIVFKGLKKLNGSNYVERAVMKAVKHNIAIYAAHTNLDNVLANGVNRKFAQKIGLQDLRILQPKSGLYSKLVIYTPVNDAERIRDAVFEAGAGHIGSYSECSFSTDGAGTFKPGDEANPAIGVRGEREAVQETKLEVIMPSHLAAGIILSVKKVHPYEEMAYDLISLDNETSGIGSGVIGWLPEPLAVPDFLALLKKNMELPLVRHTAFEGMIHQVAVCGGVGSFLTKAAMREKADAFVTSDVKYHEFFDAEKRLMLCDIGHYESEISTLEIFYEVITEKFPTFAVAFCRTSTNPIQYYQ
jgi:dinuclear metal center YbgI/SA1388 family protein